MTPLKDSWAAAVAELLAEFGNNLGDLDPSKVLANLRIWVGCSRNNSEVKEISGVLRDVLETHGAIVLPRTKPQGAFDDQLVLEQVKSADHIAMLAVTPGVSAEALELCNISKTDTDKMYVYMPNEYREGYICDLLQRKHDSGKIKFFPLNHLEAEIADGMKRLEEMVGWRRRCPRTQQVAVQRRHRRPRSPTPHDAWDQGRGR